MAEDECPPLNFTEALLQASMSGQCLNTHSKGPRHMSENPTVEIEPKPLSKAKLKIVGGADRDKWNDRLLNLTVRALPLDQKNTNSVS